MDRNRVRHHLLPLLRREYQPALDKVLARVRQIVGAEAEFAQEAALEWLASRHFLTQASRSRRNRNSRVGLNATFGVLPVAVQRRAIQIQLYALNVTADFDLVERLRLAANVPVSIGVTRVPSGGQRQLSAIRHSEGRVSLTQCEPPQFETNSFQTELVGRSGALDFEGLEINWSVIARSGDHRLNRTNQTEQFDAAGVGRRIILRHWRPGDRFRPIGMAKSLKLQDFFINEKIPRNQRHRLVVATTMSGEVFWVEGQRISERFKLTKRTISRLQWRWRRR
jgi:tRNA(Ile)-lysidine synthase